jgi:hypothetical protein
METNDWWEDLAFLWHVGQSEVDANRLGYMQGLGWVAEALS